MTVRRALCPNCGRDFNCDGSADCWCLRVERNFDYEAMILRTGAVACVCPVCLSGPADPADPQNVAARSLSDDKPDR